MMRIIAGAKRGTNLTECKSEAVRPTSNRTREALFNILTGGRFSFDIHGSQLIDACAGSGSLGLEALSRGATGAVFCELDRDSLLVLKKNIKKLGFEHQAKILSGDITSLRTWHAPPAQLVLCDAPYDSGLTTKIIPRLAGLGALQSTCIIACEVRHSESVSLPDTFAPLDNRRYGMARLFFFRYQPA
ncbi:16S rRNA (guanine(966)-N(2))-methyltransferase RsmD [Alphaproteobacteria bacterium]|nr:16S rRNA (guanine(966)-N(2))-methyltransferase RsmD [Alphaproteobacteria bacterium]